MSLGKVPIFAKRNVEISADTINLILEELGYDKIPRKNLYLHAWRKWFNSEACVSEAIKKARKEIKDEDELREACKRIVEAFIKDLDMTLGQLFQEAKVKRKAER